MQIIFIYFLLWAHICLVFWSRWAHMFQTNEQWSFFLFVSAAYENRNIRALAQNFLDYGWSDGWKSLIYWFTGRLLYLSSLLNEFPNQKIVKAGKVVLCMYLTLFFNRIKRPRVLTKKQMGLVHTTLTLLRRKWFCFLHNWVLIKQWSTWITSPSVHVVRFHSVWKNSCPWCLALKKKLETSMPPLPSLKWWGRNFFGKVSYQVLESTRQLWHFVKKMWIPHSF